MCEGAEASRYVITKVRMNKHKLREKARARGSRILDLILKAKVNY